MRRTTGVVTAAAVVLGLAGCSAAVALPSPVPTSATEPNRPRTISMQGLDPCSVFTDEQLRPAGVAKNREHPEPASADNGNAPTCQWLQTLPSDPSSGVYVQGVTYLGVDDVLKRSTDPTAIINIQGFRAVRSDNSLPSSPSCQVYVDVADGQALEVAYDFTADKRDPSLACTTAVKLADQAVSNLLSR